MPANPIKLRARTVLRNLLRLALRLRSRPLPDSKLGPILVIAPHQDDETFGCAGLVARYSRTNLGVIVAFLTNGSMSHRGHPVASPMQISALRKAEALVALGHVGLSPTAVRFFDGPDGELDRLPAADRDGIVEQIRALIEQEKPGQVFVTYRYDGSSEHAAAYLLVREALQRTRPDMPLFEYPVWSWWSPQLLFRALLRESSVYRFDLPTDLASKRAAIGAYRSQSEPLAPWVEPVLPAGFDSAFLQPTEYFYGARPGKQGE